MFRDYVRKHGLPRGLYVDQHGIYRADREANTQEVLAGKEPQTQFGRAMAELGVELILARSPQAKGRVERMNGTLQDRLVKALRRLKIRDLEAANAYLEKTFLPKFNAHSRYRRRRRRMSIRPCRAIAIWAACCRSRKNVWCRTIGRCVGRTAFCNWKSLGTRRCGPRSVSPSAKPWRGRYGCFSVIANSRGPRCGRVRKPGGRSRSRRPGDTIRSHQGQRPSAGHPWRKRLLGEGQ